jgi:uncharacterized protein (DUF983 family)
VGQRSGKSPDVCGLKLSLTGAEDEAMTRLASVLLIVIGVLLILAGIAMPLTSDAELWYAPVVLGAGIALLGAFLIAGGRSLLRARR